MSKMFIKVEPSPSEKEDQERKINYKFVRGLFKDVYILLVLAGIYPGERSRSSPKKKLCYSCLLKTYIGICLTLWFGQASVFGHAIYKTAMASQSVSRLIIYCMILSLNIHVSIFVSYIMPREMPKLRATFTKYADMYGLNMRIRGMLTNMKRATIGLILITVVSSPVSIYSLMYTSGTMCDMYPLCNFKGYLEYPVFTFNTLVFFTTTMQWQGYYLICVYFSMFLLTEFKSINREFQKLAPSLSEENETRMTELMDQHDCLVDVLNNTNNCVRHFNFIFLFFALPVNCSLIYTIISRADVIADIIICIHMTLSVSTLALRLLLDGAVSQEANGPLQYVPRLRKVTVTDRGLKHINLFLNAMIAETIGFNIYGFLTINMSSVLAIFGTFATYVIIVVQFHPTDVMSHCELLMRNITECIQP